MPNTGLFWLDRPTLGQLSGRLPQYRGYTPHPSQSAIDFVAAERASAPGGGGGGTSGGENAVDAMGDLQAILDNINEGAISDLPSGSQERIQSAIDFMEQANSATGQTETTPEQQGRFNLEAQQDLPLWAKALAAVDLPRALVTSGVKEASDALGITEDEANDGASLVDMARQMKEHYGGGQLLNDVGLEVGEAGPRVPGTSATVGEFFDRATGFAADVALDPLTYLAPGAGIVSRGGSKGLSIGLEELAGVATREGIDVAARRAGREIADEGLRRIAQRRIRELGPEGLLERSRVARQRGVSSLDDADLAIFGETGGLYLNVPGTGRVARGVANRARRLENRARSVAGKAGREAFTYEPVQIKLLERSRSLTAPLRGATAGRRAVASTQLGQKAREALGGRLAGIKNVLHTTDDAEAFHQAQRIETQDRRFSLQRKMMEAELEANGHLLERTARRAKISGKDIQSFLGGNVDAAARIEAKLPGFTDELRQFDDTVRTRANTLAGDDFIAHRSDHAYAIRPQELREYFKSIKRKPGRTRAKHPFDVEGFERKANIVEGGEFMDERLVSSADHPQGLNPREQAQAIIEDRVQAYGGKAFAMFEEDWYRVYPQQVRTTARRAAGRGMENALRGEDVLRPLYRPTKKTLREVARFERLRGNLDYLKSEVTRKAAGVEQLGERTAAATRQADAAAKAARKAAGAGDEVLAARAATNTPSARAIHQMEYAEVLQAQHNNVSAQLYALEQRELRMLTESEIGAAAKTADISMEQVKATSGRLRALRGARNNAKAKLARAQAFAEGVEVDAREVVKLQREIDELDEHLAVLQAQVDEFGRPPEAVQADIDAVRTKTVEYQDKADKLESTLTRIRRGQEAQRRFDDIVGKVRGGDKKRSWARANWDQRVDTTSVQEYEQIMQTLERNGLTVADVEAQLQNAARQVATGQKFRSSLRAELEAARGAYASEDVRLAVEELAFYQELRAEASAQAEALGNNKLVAQMAQIEQHVMDWSDKGLLYPTFMGERTSWMHGTSGKLDLTELQGGNIGGGANTRDIDSILGLHFTENPEIASMFADDFAAQGRIARKAGELDEVVRDLDPNMADEEFAALADSEARKFNEYRQQVEEETFVGNFDLHMENPKVYDLGPEDMPLTDSGWDVARDEMSLDMLDIGLERGILDVEIMRQATSDWGMETEGVWDNIIEEYFITGDIRQAIGREVHNTDLAAIDFGAKGNAMEGAEIIDQELANARAFAYEVMAQLPNEVRVELRQAVKESLAAAGHDGVMYRMVDGSYGVIALEPGQIRFRGVARGDEAKVDRLVDDWYRRQEALQDKIRSTTKVHEAAVRDLNPRIVEANGDARKAWEFHQQNQRALKRAERKLARDWEVVRRDRSNKLFEEIDLRGRVEEQYEIAARLENEDMATAMERYMAATDEYEKNAAKAAAEAAEAQAYSVRLGAAYDQAQADLIEADQRALTVEEAIQAFDEGFEPKYRKVLDHGFAQLNLRSQGPDWAVDALTQVQRLYPENGGLRDMVRAFDYATNIFKTYAVLSPGFNFRNFAGGVWNNWLAGIDQGMYSTYLRARHLYDRGGYTAVSAELGDNIARGMESIQSSGILTGGQTSELTPFLGGSTADKGLRGITAGGHNFGLRSNVFTKANVKAMGHVENTLRGSLALDTLVKGGTIDDAIDKVFHFHFDYDDLSRFEASVMRRVFPFYTWMRKNFVLQIEQMIKQPQKFNRVLRAKINMESGQDQEPIVPGYFREALAMMTPWKLDGGQVYATVDLPYQDLGLATNPREVLSAMNPWIKVPLEMATGRQFYSNVPFSGDYTAAPKTWQAIPGLMPALGLFGRARRGADGEWHMRDYDAYMVEQFMPLWGRARRLAPSEERYQSRLMTTWLSTVFGVSLRTNTQQEIEGEVRSESQDINALYEDLVNLGYVLRPGDINTIRQLQEEQRTGRQIRGTYGPDGEGGYLGGPEPTEMQQLRMAVEGGGISVSELYDENPDAAEALYG